jgi:hypothetical protein
MRVLSTNWKIVLFHGTTNIEYVTLIVDRLNSVFDNRIQLVNLNINNLNQIEYSELFVTKSIIYETIQTEIFLVFQTDS